MCAKARNRQLIPVESFFWLRRHSGHELDRGKTTFVECPYEFVELIYPWSGHLLLISPIGGQNSFELERRIFRYSYHLMHWHEFFPWLSIDTHIRFLAVHRILRWIIVRLILRIPKPLSSTLDTNWLYRVQSSN